MPVAEWPNAKDCKSLKPPVRIRPGTPSLTFIAPSSNGKSADFESVNLGSNPKGASRKVIMLEWIKIRDEVTCEVYHRLLDHNIGQYVCMITKPHKVYKVQVLNHVPWHASRLASAKAVAEKVYSGV